MQQNVQQLAIFRPGITPEEQLTLLKTYIEEFKLNKDRRLFSYMFHYPPHAHEKFRADF